MPQASTLNPHPTGAGFGEFTFNDFERPSGTADLGGTRFLHKQVDSLWHNPGLVRNGKFPFRI